MTPDLEISFSSPFVDLRGLKRLAVFFDKIRIPTLGWTWARMPPEEALRAREQMDDKGVAHGPFLARVRGVLDTRFLTQRAPELNLLEREGILVYDDQPSAIAKQLEQHLPILDYFPQYLNGAEAQVTLDGRQVLEGHSRILDCSDLEYTDYEHTFYFLSLVAYSAMYSGTSPVVTDSHTIWRILSFLHERASSKAIEDPSGRYPLEKEAYLAARLAEVNLPDLQPYSVEDVLEIRRRLKGELEPFRVELSRLVSTVSEHPADPRFHAHIDDIVKRRVMPLVVDIERKVTLSRHRFWLRLLQGFKSPKAYVALLGTVFLGIPAATSALLSIGLTAAEACVRADIEEAGIRRKGNLSFLIDLRELTK